MINPLNGLAKIEFLYRPTSGRKRAQNYWEFKSYQENCEVAGEDES
jgi:hypothetical protein